jgi:hypothetical protein
VKLLIICTFVFLAGAFYVMSGGGDFDAEATRLARVESLVKPKGIEIKAMPAPTLQSPAEQIRLTEITLPETEAQASVSMSAVEEIIRTELPQVNAPTPPIEPVDTASLAVVEDIASSAEEEATVLSAEEPEEILPSLVDNQIVVTPLDINDEVITLQDGSDIRAVSGDRVNVRDGPGTNYSVVNQLVRGDKVEVLQDVGDGWVKLRPVDGGPVGWIASFLLTEG